MKATVLGTQLVDYVSRKTNAPVKGYTLHVASKDALVDGYAVSSVFISDNLGIPGMADVRPGTRVNVEYNQRGYVCGLEILSTPTGSREVIMEALAFIPNTASGAAPASAAPATPATATSSTTKK